jgi:ParB/RepB/Spo0J family partition protein
MLMSSDQIQRIPLDQILVQKYNVRTKDIDVGQDEIAASIKAIGLIQPISVFFSSEKEKYVVLAGQRRLNAHDKLNRIFPDDGFDKIKCIVMDEPKTKEEKTAFSLAENLTQLPMANTDLVKAVTDLYNVYRDYDMVRDTFGITKYMVDKFVSLSRLPDELKDAIVEGKIHPNDKTAENSAIRAVNALQWTKGGDVDVKDVLELAKEYAKNEIDPSDLDTSAGKGGSVIDIIGGAKDKPKEKLNIKLSTEVARKLKSVSDASGETAVNRATSYVAQGAAKDYADLD